MDTVLQPDAVRPRRTLRVLLAVGSGQGRELLTDVCQGSPFFHVVGSVGSAAELGPALASLDPDVLVVDERLPALADVERLAQRLVLERSIAIALLGERPEPAAASTECERRIVGLPRRWLRGDAVARAAIRTRLQLLAARMSEPRETVPHDAILEVSDALRAEHETETPSSPATLALARTPFNLVAVVAMDSGFDDFVQVLRAVPRVRVPVVVACPGPFDAWERLIEVGATTGLPIDRAHGAMHLRRWPGVRVLTPDDAPSLERDKLRVREHGRLDAAAFVSMLAPLGPTVCAIAMHPVGRATLAALGRIGMAGGYAFVGLDKPSDAPVGVPALDLFDLAWFLRNATPRRV